MEDKVVMILKGFYRIIEDGRLMLLHSLRERIIITIITSILSTIARRFIIGIQWSRVVCGLFFVSL